MIGWLKGQVLDNEQPGKLVLNVNGVGYDVETSLSTFFQCESMDQELGLFIHTVVREDAFLLYGFLEKQERSLFRALIKVNGVGPKVAMAILSSISPQEFIQCIHEKNTALLTKLPGIGKKTAERLVVEMKDSLTQVSQTTHKNTNDQRLHHQSEAIQALEALGYRAQEASKVIHKIDDGQKTSEQLIRQALQLLATC
ncbi:MAG: Holliday junction branch migration protein RuvA [Legionellaceae bacterium]